MLSCKGGQKCLGGEGEVVSERRFSLDTKVGYNEPIVINGMTPITRNEWPKINGCFPGVSYNPTYNRSHFTSVITGRDPPCTKKMAGNSRPLQLFLGGTVALGKTWVA